MINFLKGKKKNPPCKSCHIKQRQHGSSRCSWCALKKRD